MNLAPRKLQAAHRLLVGLLADGKPRPIEHCIAEAAALGISQRTLYEARARMPIDCPERDYRGVIPGRWRLISRKIAAPEEWKRRRVRHCLACGESLVGEHWRRKRCRNCKVSP